MVQLKLLAKMDNQLRKTRGAIVSSIALFSGLPLIILMGDFYQFAPTNNRLLWDRPYSEEETHGKVLWDNFQVVLSFIKQMQPRFDLVFQAMLKLARNKLVNLNNVNTLNAQVATHLPNFDFNNTVVVLQKNRTRYLIKCLQAQNFTLFQNLELILFSAKHSQN